MSASQERSLSFSYDLGMPDVADRSPARRSEARERLLGTASRLFYSEGISGVGVDRIVSEAHVTLATFYRHFPGKEALVIAYLEAVHVAIETQVEAQCAGRQGRDRVRALGDQVVSEAGREGFRGCAFMNASSEFEDPDSPVRQVIAGHRQWYYDTARRAFLEAGHQHPGNAARHFVMLRDGAMTGGALDSVTIAKRTFRRGVEGLLRSIDMTPLDPSDDGDAAGA
jgi:AcrR family transcriptional regulator